METRLKPIEKPSGLMMKIAYAMSKRQFGKVLTPLKVIYSRLPLSFALVSQKFGKLAEKLTIPATLNLLIKTHVAQLNMCTFCIDIAKSMAIEKQANPEKFYHLQNFRENDIFSPAEKAALLFAEELTINKKISDETFALAQKYFNERQLAEIAWTVAVEHYYNIQNLAFNIHSDNLCDVRMKKK